MKTRKSKNKPKSNSVKSQRRTKSSSKYEFGYLEKVSINKALGLEAGAVLGVFGHACNCASGCTDAYTTTSLCDFRSA